MPQVSLWGKVISDRIVFVHRAMAVAQLTHLHLLVPSSGMTTGTVPPECFPVVPVPRKPRGVSFASDVEVMLSTSTLPSPGAEPDSPDQPLPSQTALLSSAPDDDSNHGQDVFVITPPAYVLFPFADPLDDEDMLSRPQFPSLPGFATIDNQQPGALPGPAGIAAHDWSSFIRPGSPLQLLPGWGRLEILDTSSRLMSDTSVISDGTWFSASDSPVRQTQVLCPMTGRVPSRHRCPTRALGILQVGFAFRCTTHRISDFACPSTEFGLPLHHPRFLEWVGAPESTRLL